MPSIPAAVLALALSAAAASASASVDPSIPFRFEDLRVYVPATFGTHSGAYVLDTGASDVMIDSATADAVGLRAASMHSEHGAGRGSLQMGGGGAASLLVGGVPLKVASADVAAINRVLRPYNGLDIGGVIGAPFFMAHVVEIDFAQRRLVLHDPSTFAYQGPGVRLPFQFVDGDPVAQGELTLGDGTRLPLRLLIDLGAKADLLVAEPFVKAHQLLTRMGPTVTEPLGAGVGGETRYAFARLAGLKAGDGVAATDLIAGLSVNGTLRGGDYDALLGAGFLQRFRVFVDYPHQAMIFEPRAPSPAERFDRSGAFLVAGGPGLGRLVVHEVLAGSPADQAGVRSGDVVEAVDGRAARGLRIWDVRSALSAPGDRVVTLTLRRGDYDALLGAGFLQRFRVFVDYPHQAMIFEPRAPAPAERFDRSGAFLVAGGPRLGRLVVHEVLAGSPADQAGVRSGDVVEAVDGRAVRGLRIWDVRSALSAPGDRVVTLTLRRAGGRLSAPVRLKDLI